MRPTVRATHRWPRSDTGRGARASSRGGSGPGSGRRRSRRARCRRRSRTTGRSQAPGKRSLRHRTKRVGMSGHHERPGLGPVSRIAAGRGGEPRPPAPTGRRGRRRRALESRALGLPSRVREHLLGRFARRRDHGGDEHDQPGADPLGHDRRNVAAERLGDDDHVRRSPIASTTARRTPPGRPVVLDGEVGRDRVVAGGRSSASTRCQYQPTSPAPWMKAKVAMPSLCLWPLAPDRPHAGLGPKPVSLPSASRYVILRMPFS